jgi:hypothetical protein
MWGVHVRLVMIGMIYICMPNQCERSSFPRGCNVYDEVVGIVQVII